MKKRKAKKQSKKIVRAKARKPSKVAKRRKKAKTKRAPEPVSDYEPVQGVSAEPAQAPDAEEERAKAQTQSAI